MGGRNIAGIKVTLMLEKSTPMVSPPSANPWLTCPTLPGQLSSVVSETEHTCKGVQAFSRWHSPIAAWHSVFLSFEGIQLPQFSYQEWRHSFRSHVENSIQSVFLKRGRCWVELLFFHPAQMSLVTQQELTGKAYFTQNCRFVFIFSTNVCMKSREWSSSKLYFHTHKVRELLCSPGITASNVSQRSPSNLKHFGELERFKPCSSSRTSMPAEQPNPT